MAKVGFYLSEREKEWVRRQGPGWFRMVVRKYMKAYPDKMPVKDDIRSVPMREQI